MQSLAWQTPYAASVALKKKKEESHLENDHQLVG